MGKIVKIAEPISPEEVLLNLTRRDLYSRIESLQRRIDYLRRTYGRISEGYLPQAEDFNIELEEFYELVRMFRENEAQSQVVDRCPLEDLKVLITKTDSFRQIADHYSKVLADFFNHIELVEGAISRGAKRIEGTHQQIQTMEETEAAWVEKQEKKKRCLASLRKDSESIESEEEKIKREMDKISGKYLEAAEKFKDDFQELGLGKLIEDLKGECWAKYVFCVGPFVGGISYDGLEVFKSDLLTDGQFDVVPHSSRSRAGCFIFFIRMVVCILVFGIDEKTCVEMKEKGGKVDKDVCEEPEEIEWFWHEVERRSWLASRSSRLRKGLCVRARRQRIHCVMGTLCAMPKEIAFNNAYNVIQSLAQLKDQLEEIQKKGKDLFNDDTERRITDFLELLIGIGTDLGRAVPLPQAFQKCERQKETLMARHCVVSEELDKSRVRVVSIEGSLIRVRKNLEELGERLTTTSSSLEQFRTRRFQFSPK